MYNMLNKDFDQTNNKCVVIMFLVISEEANFLKKKKNVISIKSQKEICCRLLSAVEEYTFGSSCACGRESKSTITPMCSNQHGSWLYF